MTHPAMIERVDLKYKVRVFAMNKNEDKKYSALLVRDAIIFPLSHQRFREVDVRQRFEYGV